MKKAFDTQKLKAALKPVNMEILYYLGKTTLATTKDLIVQYPHFSQASIYRAVSELLELQLILVDKSEKVHSVEQRYFKLGYDITAEFGHDISTDQYEDVLQLVHIWMSTVTGEIQHYLDNWVQTKDPIRFGMGREILHLNDDQMMSFYKDIYSVIKKYQALPAEDDASNFSFSASWVPIQKG